MDLEGLRRPLAYIVEPLAWAHREGADLLLGTWIVLQASLLALLWGLFGGAILRLATADLSGEGREEGREAFSFARRHWTGFVGARLALWAGVLAPLALAAAVAALARIPGAPGGLLLALAVGVALIAALVSVFVLSVTVLGGGLAGSTVAAEDSDAFDAVARTVAYTASGVPRLVGARLVFLSGVLLGSGWRLVKTAFVALLAYGCLHLGGGEAALEGPLAILGAGGTPPDAGRLGIGWADWVVAGALALAAGGLAILWAADLVSRVLCARAALYLWLRQAVDGTPVRALRTAPRGPAHQGADEAGFVEVARVE